MTPSRPRDTLNAMAIVPIANGLFPPEPALGLLRRLGEAAANAGASLWLVGGPVRDAFLSWPIRDLDLASETPADDLGPLLAEELGGSCGARSAFGTVKIRADGKTVDLATTRAERYAKPGALPSVTWAGLEADLARRDFSVNAMAASLRPDRFAELLDTRNGEADLAAGVIRALHPKSFVDDPTRCFRAARYAARLGFDVEPATRRWMRSGLPHLQDVSPARIRREIERILAERYAPRALAAAIKLGALPAIEPTSDAPAVRKVLERASQLGAGRLAALAALAYALPDGRAEAFSERISATKPQREVIKWAVRLREAEPRLRRTLRPSETDAIVGRAPDDAIEGACAAASSPVARRNLIEYLFESDNDDLLDGDELMALGVPPGPEVGEMAEALRRAVLDDVVRTPAGAKRFVENRLVAKRHGLL